MVAINTDADMERNSPIWMAITFSDRLIVGPLTYSEVFAIASDYMHGHPECEGVYVVKVVRRIVH